MIVNLNFITWNRICLKLFALECFSKENLILTQCPFRLKKIGISLIFEPKCLVKYYHATKWKKIQVRSSKA